jgi:hypothetical protein
MSTERIEAALKAKPKPGEVGGPMVGYAEAQRVQQQVEPSEFVDAREEAEQKFSKASGKPIGEMTEQDFYRLPVVLNSRPQQAMTELHVVFKDPAYTGHWFNWKAKQPDRVAQAYMQGFTACTKDDVEACHIRTTDENGSLVYGDLVLMKIPKAILWGGYYKQNMDTAVSRVERAATKNPELERKSRDGAIQQERIGSIYEGSINTQTADADYRQVNGARELVYSE